MRDPHAVRAIDPALYQCDLADGRREHSRRLLVEPEELAAVPVLNPDLRPHLLDRTDPCGKPMRPFSDTPVPDPNCSKQALTVDLDNKALERRNRLSRAEQD